MRQKRCKSPACGKLFDPVRPLQAVCCPECAIAWSNQGKGKQAAEKVLRAATRERKAAIKTRSQLIKEAQAAFNRLIRLRDQGKPCICCGKPLAEGSIGGGYDAGHYRSVGSAPHLRFDERNVHAQRKQCNRYGAGRAVDYRLGLIARIGLAEVEALEADQEPRKWSRDELIALAADYRAKCREIEKAAR